MTASQRDPDARPFTFDDYREVFGGLVAEDGNDFAGRLDDGLCVPCILCNCQGCKRCIPFGKLTAGDRDCACANVANAWAPGGEG